MGLVFDHEMGGALMTAAGYEVGLWAFFAGFDRSVLQFKPGILIDGEENAARAALHEATKRQDRAAQARLIARIKVLGKMK